MQFTFDFGAAATIVQARGGLRATLGHFSVTPEREPTGQLVKSLISGRTRDDVSLGAYGRLIRTYSRWSSVAAAAAGEVEAVIDAVTFPDVKARHLTAALRAIAERHADFDLGFLGEQPVAEALAWLERLPGVGRKVSASTLNFSTLSLPAFVVDTHVLRVLRRLGLVGARAETRTAYDAVMAATVEWTAADLAELHVLLKRLGQTVCRVDRACCESCPIDQLCRHAIR